MEIMCKQYIPLHAPAGPWYVSAYFEDIAISYQEIFCSKNDKICPWARVLDGTIE